MSNVTLETLRADFEAKRFPCRNARTGGAVDVFERLLSICVPGPLRSNGKSDLTDNAFDAMLRAAIVLYVAEKHGLNAAMLWKLSDGAIDPRATL